MLHCMCETFLFCLIVILATMVIVLSSWRSHCKSSPDSFDECRMASSGCRPFDLGSRLTRPTSVPVGLYHLHSPSLWTVCIITAEVVTGWIYQTRGHGTYTAGVVNFAPLLKVGQKSVYFPSHFWGPDVPKMHQIAQICAYIFRKFSGVTPRTSKTGEGLSSLPRLLPLDKRPPSRFFRASVATVPS